MNEMLPPDMIPTEAAVRVLVGLAQLLTPAGLVEVADKLAASASQARADLEALTAAQRELADARAEHERAVGAYNADIEELNAAQHRQHKYDLLLQARERQAGIVEQKAKDLAAREVELSAERLEVERLKADLVRKLSAITELARN